MRSVTTLDGKVKLYTSNCLPFSLYRMTNSGGPAIPVHLILIDRENKEHYTELFPFPLII